MVHMRCFFWRESERILDWISMRSKPRCILPNYIARLSYFSVETRWHVFHAPLFLYVSTFEIMLVDGNGNTSLIGYIYIEIYDFDHFFFSIQLRAVFGFGVKITVMPRYSYCFFSWSTWNISACKMENANISSHEGSRKITCTIFDPFPFPFIIIY